MNDSDIQGPLRSGPPWENSAPPDRFEVRPPVTGFTNAAQWGLASLLIGCTLLLAACGTLIFNVLLFRAGPAGIPTGLAFVGGLIGTLVVSALGLASVVFGVLGWQRAYAAGSSPALGVAGVVTSIVGLIAWLIAAIDLIAILEWFVR
jgi:hypothetical protein